VVGVGTGASLSHDRHYQAVGSSGRFLLVYFAVVAPLCVDSDCSVVKRGNFTLWW